MAKETIKEWVRRKQETPESAVRNIACLIGYVRIHLTDVQYQCAVDCLRELAEKARVSDSVVDAALD